MPDPILFDRDRLLAALHRLDSKLEAQGQPHQKVIVVGGSYLALAELREATRDVDVITRLTSATRRAIHDVATELHLSPRWMNDEAAAFMPAGLAASHCTEVLTGSALTVLVPSADWIFLMKLYAARATDRPDLIRLWPHAGFESVARAVERYWGAYPHAPDDEHLDIYINDIAGHGL